MSDAVARGTAGVCERRVWIFVFRRMEMADARLANYCGTDRES